MLLVLNAMSQGTLIISFMVIVVIRGSSRFFLSLEDNIFRIIGGDRIQVSFSHSMAQESKTKSLEIVQLLQNVCAKYCYLLEDLSPKLLAEKRSTLESLGDDLHFQGQEALLTEKAQTCAAKSWQQSLVMELQHRMWMTQQTNFWAGVAKIIFNQMASML
ncbi:unnamed protein product [Sphagnum jensenii]|uniref:ATP synthase protein MI25 n=1 Tax=Sphagnum jensenii TaxID=128206 RepID=A0ABP0WNU4_9BRYO